MPIKPSEPLTTRIPADIDHPDKIVYGLTARQLVILAAAGLLAAWLYLGGTAVFPIPVVIVMVFPILTAGVALAMARRDGMSLDRFVLHALAHLRAARTRVQAPEGVPPTPEWCRVRERLPAPLQMPVHALRGDGVLDLADGGTAAIIRASTIPFGLRTTTEQSALVAGFGRWLNSLEASVQILIHARPVDLSGFADQITAKAPSLADPALEKAARDHAAFLAKLNEGFNLLSRQVLIVLRDQSTGPPGVAELRRPSRQQSREAGATVVLQQAEEAIRRLSLLGINAEILDAPSAAAVLSDSLSPGEDRLPGMATPQEVITARSTDPMADDIQEDTQ